ncbi:hypothetical protein HYALB_00013837 [Hymenoscyphus albidus]|uniref:Uncharacterized protein n=1 Tax=Hymenoscyphus albidus TaxID=595503 RepID=A0A9N9M0N7_9HELO|nr:hypothetical protein HYALB_00013837 [Hymenoscyphus albidus]
MPPSRGNDEFANRTRQGTANLKEEFLRPSHNPIVSQSIQRNTEPHGLHDTLPSPRSPPPKPPGTSGPNRDTTPNRQSYQSPQYRGPIPENHQSHTNKQHAKAWCSMT